MAPTYPSGYTPSLMPVIALAVRLGVGPGGTPPATLKTMLLGNRTSAGSLAAATPVEVFGPEEGDAYFGGRSELAHMIRAFRKIAPTGRLFACAVAESAGNQATAVLTFAGPATAAGVVRIRVAGRRGREVPVASGDTAATVAAAVAAEVAAQTEWPCTGACGTDTNTHVLTLTAAQHGLRGNSLRVVVEVTATGVTVALGAGSAAASVKGPFSGGTTADDFTAALAAIAGERYDRIGAACDDDTNRALVAAHAAARSGINEGRRCMAVCASTIDTVSSTGSVIEDAGAHNEPRLTLVYGRRCHRPPGELVGAYLAAKVHGDGRLPGEVQYRAAKANGMSLYPAIEAIDVEDRPTDTQVRALLVGGVTPLGADGLHPGYASIVRPVTTRTKNAAGGTSLLVIDPSKVAVADLVADRIEAFAAQNYGDKNLVPDPPSIEEAVSSEYVTWPASIREDVLGILRAMEGEALLVNVTAHAADVTVGAAADDDTVVIVKVPVAVIPHFHSLVGEVQQVA